MKILIVEDDSGTREIVRRALEGAGYESIAVQDGEEALALIDAERPGLVILDVGLPGIDGFEVCRRIRLNSRVPIMMLTSASEEADLRRAFELGTDDYLTKPFTGLMLVARVGTMLARTVAAN
jgi:two-component system, OmpR family, response regulator ResD